MDVAALQGLMLVLGIMAGVGVLLTVLTWMEPGDVQTPLVESNAPAPERAAA